MNTKDTTAQSWRDLTDQLTPYQINLFTERERLFVELDRRPADTTAKWLLADAVADVENNEQDRRLFGDVPAPAGCRFLWHWDPDENGGYERAFEADEWTLGRLAVSVHGSQRPDGSVTAWLNINGVGSGVDLSTEQARWLADKIALAAEAVDRLNGDSPPFM
jgi:hypothetical protein